MVKKGVRITEVDIGNIIHKKQPIENLTLMSEQVIKTVLSELGIIANKHKLIIFDFDNTLIEQSSIELLAKEFGFTKELKNLRAKHAKKKIKDYEITLALAKLLKGKSLKQIENACKNIIISKNTLKVIERLKKRQYMLAIISSAFSPVVEYIAQEIGIDAENIICPQLVRDGHNIFTGEVIAKTTFLSDCCDRIICKSNSAKELMSKLSVKSEECIAVGDGKSDECLFKVCGLSLAFNSKLDLGDVKINEMSEILIYAE
ncbi:MAG: HAD-IB family phosphatase [archaeon]